MNFGMTPGRADGEIHRNLNNAIAARDGLDSELGLDFEAAAKESEILDEGTTESAVARQGVGQSHAENEFQNEKNEAVRPTIEMLEFALGASVETRADDHVGITGGDGPDERMDRGRGIGRVTIDHDVNVGVDMAEDGLDKETPSPARVGGDSRSPP